MLYAEYRCFAQFLRYWAFCPLHIYLQVRTTQAPKNKDKAIWVTVLVGMVIVHVTFTWRIKRAKEACYLTTIICVYMCLFSTTMLHLQWYIVTYFTFYLKKTASPVVLIPHYCDFDNISINCAATSWEAKSLQLH